jgi:hypothetical protein
LKCFQELLMIKATKRLLATATAIGVVANTGYAEAGSSCPGSGAFGQVGLGAAFTSDKLVKGEKNGEAEETELDKATRELAQKFHEAIGAIEGATQPVTAGAVLMSNRLLEWFGMNPRDNLPINNGMIPAPALPGAVPGSPAGSIGALCDAPAVLPGAPGGPAPYTGAYRDTMIRLRNAHPDLFQKIRNVAITDVRRVAAVLRESFQRRLMSGESPATIVQEMTIAAGGNVINVTAPQRQEAIPQATLDQIEAAVTARAQAERRLAVMRDTLIAVGGKTKSQAFRRLVFDNPGEEGSRLRPKSLQQIDSGLQQYVNGRGGNSRAQDDSTKAKDDEACSSKSATAPFAALAVGWRISGGSCSGAFSVEAAYRHEKGTRVSSADGDKSAPAWEISRNMAGKACVDVGVMITPNVEAYLGAYIEAGHTTVKSVRSGSVDELADEEKKNVIEEYNKRVNAATAQGQELGDEGQQIQYTPTGKSGETKTKAPSDRQKWMIAPGARVGVKFYMEGDLYVLAQVSHTFSARTGDESKDGPQIERSTTEVSVGLGKLFATGG